MLHNEDIRQPGLGEHFDAIVLASQSAQSILHGVRDGELPPSREGAPAMVLTQRPEYAGGIGLDGLVNLDRFVRNGGMLVALDGATELPIQFFPLPVRNVARGTAFSCPGSLLRFTSTAGEPLAFGMPAEFTGFSTGGGAFEIAQAPSYNTGDREVKVVARYAGSNLLASGWVAGETRVLGAPALVEARHGRGRVVLIGFRAQFRGQTFGTFKFLLNAVYLASAERTGAPPPAK